MIESRACVTRGHTFHSHSATCHPSAIVPRAAGRGAGWGLNERRQPAKRLPEHFIDDAPEKADELSAPEPERVPDTIIVNDTPPASPVKAKKKKSKKPVVIVSASDSGSSSDDNSNVIYIRRKSKSKDTHKSATAPQQPPQPPPPPIINPFFSYYHGSQRNFQ